MQYILAFVAGFVSTLTFHQSVLAALHVAGLWPRPAYSMIPTPPLNVPAVISLAFWGGVWGVALWLVIRVLPGAQYWIYATLLGAIGPSIIALFVVFPAKGMPVAGGWKAGVIVPVLILNGAWGLGVAVLMRMAGSL
jgi:hypothetical protein